jgi:hypothetical protein
MSCKFANCTNDSEFVLCNCNNSNIHLKCLCESNLTFTCDVCKHRYYITDEYIKDLRFHLKNLKREEKTVQKLIFEKVYKPRKIKVIEIQKEYKKKLKQINDDAFDQIKTIRSDTDTENHKKNIREICYYLDNFQKQDETFSFFNILNIFSLNGILKQN